MSQNALKRVRAEWEWCSDLALEQMLQERINYAFSCRWLLATYSGIGVCRSCTNFEPHGATLKLTDLELYSLVVAAKAGTFQLPLQQQSLGHTSSHTELVSNGSVLPLIRLH